MANQPCPCGNKNNFSQCCGKYISGEMVPDTAETLMRSRYSAYTLANISYIQETMCEDAAVDFDPVSAQQWAKTIKWKRLKVLRTFPHDSDPNRYFVEFSAYYIASGRPQELHEISEFKRINGKWYYINGNIT